MQQNDSKTKGQKTKELIMEKAYDLFAEKGFKEVTMTDICTQTGLSRGGLYRHYSGTAEIFKEILSREITMEDRIREGESAVQILNEMLLLIREEILEKEKSLSLAIYEYASLGNQEFITEINERAKNRWRGLIEYGIRKGEFQPVDIEAAVELILYYYQGLRMWSRVVPFSEETADHYVEIIQKQLQIT